ncbi:MAG: hypothetical protein RIB57_03175 [Pelagibacterium sp.]|uniref:hypothetical protein n=1 Tax=Pelagibacterium sp. TaxID=1967288 RepID=UPI0032EB2F25
MHDLYSDTAVVTAISPAVKSAGENGAAVDLQGAGSAVVTVGTGAIAGDGDFTFKVQHSDTTTSGDFTDAAATDIHGDYPTTMEADSAYSVGYVGGKRYIRVATVKNGGTSIAAGALVVKSHLSVAPAA